MDIKDIMFYEKDNRLPTISFNSYNVSKYENYRCGLQINGCQELQMQWRVGCV